MNEGKAISGDLEQLLRRTLEDRAAVVTSGPGWQQPEPRSTRRRWVPALAAAAAVAAVAVAVTVLLPGAHDRGTPSLTQPPTVATTTPPTGTTTPPPTGGLHAASCSAALPAAWQRAITAGAVPASAGKLTPLSMTPAGEVLARRSSGGHDQVVLVRPDRSTTVLYTAPALDIALAAGDQQWIMVTRTQPGGSPYAIDAIDRSTGSVIPVRPASVRPDAIVQPPVLFGNAIYWTEGDQYGVGAVRAFDLTHRTTRVLDHGYLSQPVSFGGGLFWLKSDTAGSKAGRLITHAPGTLPPGFEVQAWSGYAALVEDGSDYAWGSYLGSGPQYEFRVWTPGAAAPVLAFAPSQAGAGEVPVLSMPYLFARGRVVDLRTGASAPLPDAVPFAADGVLVVRTGDRLSIVRTAQLPQPRC